MRDATPRSTNAASGLSDTPALRAVAYPATASARTEPTRTMSARPEDVFERHYARLVQSLTISAGDRETAADAVQEAFVRLVRDWDRLSTYEDPAGWVRRVALNQIRDHHRSLWRRARLLVRMGVQDPPPPASDGDQRLRAKLGELAPKQRTAVALYYMDHLSTREVAEAMEVSEGTVKQHLYRARETLREALDGGDDG